MEVFLTSWPIWKKSTKRITIHQYLSCVQAFICVFIGMVFAACGRSMVSSVIRSLVKKYSSMIPNAVTRAKTIESILQWE